MLYDFSDFNASILCCNQRAEEAVLCDSNTSDSSWDKTSVQLPAKDGGNIEENKEEKKKQSVATVSIEIQTDHISEGELLSLQQQKM